MKDTAAGGICATQGTFSICNSFYMQVHVCCLYVHMYLKFHPSPPKSSKNTRKVKIHVSSMNISLFGHLLRFLMSWKETSETVFCLRLKKVVFTVTSFFQFFLISIYTKHIKCF